MPITVIPDDLLEVTVNCATGEGQFSANVFHMRVASVTGVGPTDLAITIFYADLLAPLYKAALPAECVYWGTRVQIIKPTRRPGQFLSTNRGAGDVAGDTCPTQVCGLLTATTNLTGPRYRGKMFIPFPAEASNDVKGDPEAAYLAAIDAIRTAVYFGQTVNPGVGVECALTPVVYSKLFDLRTPITASSRSTLWATLRKRSARSTQDQPPG